MAVNLTSFGEEAMYNIVEKYLSLNGTAGWTSLHQGAILTSAAVQGTKKLGVLDLTHLVNPPANAVARALDLTARVLSDPNIEGICIHTPKIQWGRQADVSESATIVQSGRKKEYLMDNITPRLRNWSFSGYISSCDGILDVGQTIKPTLVAQYTFLDACMVSRHPVWFKDNNNMFHQALITQLQGEQDPTATNVIKITISLKEYKPLVMETSFVHGERANPISTPEGVQQ